MPEITMTRKPSVVTGPSGRPYFSPDKPYEFDSVTLSHETWEMLGCPEHIVVTIKASET